jgi:RNA recognition motif-containing protein
VRLFISNLPWSVTTEELRGLFEKCGQVDAALVIRDKVTGKSRGIGFVTMSNDTEAALAIEQLHGYFLGGRNLRVNEAQPSPTFR